MCRGTRSWSIWRGRCLVFSIGLLYVLFFFFVTPQSRLMSTHSLHPQPRSSHTLLPPSLSPKLPSPVHALTAFPSPQDDILGTGGSTPAQALADLDACGFHGLLTSGGPGAAPDNVGALREVLGAARLGEVIVGGGVRSANVGGLAAEDALLRAAAGGEGGGGGEREQRPRVAVWFHSSCLTRPGESDVVDQAELRAIVDGMSRGRGVGERVE